MTVTGQNFEVYQGDSKELIITVLDENLAVLNLTAYDAIWVIYDLTTFAILLQKDLGAGITIPTPADGQIVIALDSVDTASLTPKTYGHQCEIEDSDQNHSTVTTGQVKILKSITHSQL